MHVTQSGDERRIAALLTTSLIERFPAAIDDPVFLDAALRDCFGDGLRRERDLLVAAARAGVPRRALAGVSIESEALDFDANPADARWAAATWFEACAKLRFVQQSALTQPYSPLVPSRPKARAPRRIAPLAAALALCALAGSAFLAVRAHHDGNTVALTSPLTAPTASPAAPSPVASFDWSKLLATDAPLPRATATPVAVATLAPTDAPETPSPEPAATDAPAALATDEPQGAGTASPGNANRVPARQFDLLPGEDLSSAPSALDACIADWKARRWDDAKISCRDAAQADPDDAEPELLLGESYYGCACYSGAIAPLTSALRLAATDEQKLEAYRYRGYVNYELWTGDGDDDELEDALSDFGGALEIDDADPTTLYDYGAAAYKLEHWCKAEDAFSTLAQRYPDDRDSEYWWRMSANNHEQYGCT